VLSLFIIQKYYILFSVHPGMVDFGSEQGLSDFEITGRTSYFEDFKRAKTQLWAKRCRLWMGVIYPFCADGESLPTVFDVCASAFSCDVF